MALETISQYAKENLADFKRTIYFMVGVAIADLVLLVYARDLVALPIALFLAFAATTVGAIIGFLFGIPPVAKEDVLAPSQNPAGTKRRRLTVNTNLEEISNWLTKVLVGASLVQLQSLPGALRSIGEYINPGDRNAHDVTTIAICILLSSSIFGFFLGYLTTRLFLAGAFDRAESNDDDIGGAGTVVTDSVVANSAGVVATPEAGSPAPASKAT